MIDKIRENNRIETSVDTDAALPEFSDVEMDDGWWVVPYRSVSVKINQYPSVSMEIYPWQRDIYTKRIQIGYIISFQYYPLIYLVIESIDCYFYFVIESREPVDKDPVG